jgi:7-keto-8-aminopelargonate synthetase-like enzyme
MDGDRIDADLLRSHLHRGGCLYLDEAHALGLFPGGTGYATHNGIAPTVVVGTLGKAFGCAGAFLAGTRTLCEWLRAHARSFVFTTGLSPALLPRIAAAIDIVTGADGDRRRERLWSNVRRLSDRLAIVQPPSPIFPLLVGENDVAVAIANALLARGWHVHPIRPPTVPVGTARLRVTVTAAHTAQNIDAFARDVLAAFARHDRPIIVDPGRTKPLSSDPPTPPVSASQ